MFNRPDKMKQAHIVPCSSRFRQEIEALVRNRNVANDNIGVGDLARSIMLLIPNDIIQAQPDPGEPDKNDRDIVTVTTGKAAGRTMPRKPRLQVRMPQPTDPATIRKALGLALSLEKGWVNLALDQQRADSLAKKLEFAEAELARMQDVLGQLAFQPLPNGVKTRAEALYVLGFAPSAQPSQAEIKVAFRQRAKLFHPDRQGDPQARGLASDQRMAQLSAAVKLLGA